MITEEIFHFVAPLTCSDPFRKECSCVSLSAPPPTHTHTLKRILASSQKALANCWHHYVVETKYLFSFCANPGYTALLSHWALQVPSKQLPMIIFFPFLKAPYSHLWEALIMVYNQIRGQHQYFAKKKMNKVSQWAILSPRTCYKV